MAENLPTPPSSSYAEEGTAAHGLAELKARLHFGLGGFTKEDYLDELAAWEVTWPGYASHEDTMAEMHRHTDAYVELLAERVAAYPHGQVRLEQRLPTGLPQSWGTSDAVVVSPRHVEIVDFKYGAGVAVSAEGNPQLRLYALGALDTYGDVLGETEVVLMTVHQPRMDHVLTAEMTPEALREWRSRILPIAEEALGPDARFGPSEEACRWCPASGRCRAQVEAAFPDDLKDPDLLSPEEVAAYADRLPELRVWMKAFEEAALTMAYSEGREIPGYKVVLSGGKRSVTRPDEAIEHLVGHLGWPREQVTKVSLRGIGELEKLMGKEEFAEALDPYIKPPEGKPALVPESDKRPSVNPNSEAAKAFEDNEE